MQNVRLPRDLREIGHLFDRLLHQDPKLLPRSFLHLHLRSFLKHRLNKRKKILNQEMKFNHQLSKTWLLHRHFQGKKLNLQLHNL